MSKSMRSLFISCGAERCTALVFLPAPGMDDGREVVLSG